MVYGRRQTGKTPFILSFRMPTVYVCCLPSTIYRLPFVRLELPPETALGLEKNVLRVGFGNLQHGGNLGMLEALHLKEHENLALPGAQFSEAPFQGQPHRV